MEEELIYTIKKRFPQGEAELILFAKASPLGGVVYWFEHSNQLQYCESFEEAIILAKDEWIHKTYKLSDRETQPAFLSNYDSDPELF